MFQLMRKNQQTIRKIKQLVIIMIFSIHIKKYKYIIQLLFEKCQIKPNTKGIYGIGSTSTSLILSYTSNFLFSSLFNFLPFFSLTLFISLFLSFFLSIFSSSYLINVVFQLSNPREEVFL